MVNVNMLFITGIKSYLIREIKVTYIEYDERLEILRIHLLGGKYLQIRTPMFFEDDDYTDPTTVKNIECSREEIRSIWEKLQKTNYGEYYINFSEVSMEVFNSIYIDGGNLDVATTPTE